MSCQESDVDVPVAVVTCPEGEECPEPEEAPEPETVMVCAPKACASDSDCGSADLICLEVEVGCDDVALAMPECEGEDCPEAEMPGEPCEDETKKFCAPKWLGSCKADSDCGEGFECVEAEVCECSSSASTGSAPSSGSDTDTPTPEPDGEPGGDNDSRKADGHEDDPDCDCKGTGEFHCKVLETTCAEDSDCPSGWSCLALGGSVSVTEVPCPPDDADCEPTEEVDEKEEEKICLPPNALSWAEAAGEAGYSGGAATGEVALEDSDDGASNAPNSSGGTKSGSGGGGGSGSGCQAASGLTDTVPLWLALMFLLVLSVRGRMRGTRRGSA